MYGRSMDPTAVDPTMGRLGTEVLASILNPVSVLQVVPAGINMWRRSVLGVFGLEGKGFIPVPDTVVSVVQVFSFDDQATNNMFDLRYQLRLNDLYDFSSTSIIHYEMTQRHLDFLSHLLVGEKPIRFNQHQNRLYIDMDWTNDITAGEFLVIECYRKLDPASYTDIFDDIYLKRYATALIKRQWGANLSKFNGVAMLGGVTMNGEQIYSQAIEEIQRLEEQIQLQFETPVDLMRG